MYGLLGFKTHAKVLLVVRKERNGLRRYVHLATGNYNQQTARLYTDVSLFTAREDIAEDATSLFNLLTGYSAPARWNRLIVVAARPARGRARAHRARDRSTRAPAAPARIVAKMNSLVDADVIEALYAASQAGVEIDLLVRGICCLRPGVPGVSEHIRVHAIIDRFLEHARIFHFTNGGNDEVYCSSADWMPRNFHRRVEVMFPILDESLKRRVIDEILGTMRARQRARPGRCAPTAATRALSRRTTTERCAASSASWSLRASGHAKTKPSSGFRRRPCPARCARSTSSGAAAKRRSAATTATERARLYSSGKSSMVSSARFSYVAVSAQKR